MHVVAQWLYTVTLTVLTCLKSAIINMAKWLYTDHMVLCLCEGVTLNGNSKRRLINNYKEYKC